MPQTSHTVQTAVGSGHRITVDHEDYTAIQYDFYIPEAIWNHLSVQRLIQRLQSLAPGATIFGELTGVWQGARETTRIYRLILHRDSCDLSNTLETLHSEVGRLMADLSASPQDAQQAFMFTETDIRATLSKK